MKKRTDEARIKIYWGLSLAIVTIWAIGYITGSRLSYIYTDFAFGVRAFVIFPILLGVFCYVGLIKRKGGRKTAHRIFIDTLSSRTEKIKKTFGIITGLLLLTGGFSWTTVAFSAWAAELTASTPFSQTYTVTDISERSGPVWSTLFDLTLIKDGTETVDLRLKRRRYEEYHWKAGDIICVYGRTSVFGSIADRVTKGSCEA